MFTKTRVAWIAYAAMFAGVLVSSAVVRADYIQTWTGTSVENWRVSPLDALNNVPTSNPGAGGNTGGASDGYLAFNGNINATSQRAVTPNNVGPTYAPLDANFTGSLWAKYGPQLQITLDAKVFDQGADLYEIRLYMSRTDNWDLWIGTFTFPTPQTAADGWVTRTISLDQSWDTATATANGWADGGNLYGGVAGRTSFSQMGASTTWFELNIRSHSATASVGFDNVGIKAVPEPAAIVSLIIGSVGIAGVTWRRRNGRHA